MKRYILLKDLKKKNIRFLRVCLFGLNFQRIIHCVYHSLQGFNVKFNTLIDEKKKMNSSSVFFVFRPPEYEMDTFPTK